MLKLVSDMEHEAKEVIDSLEAFLAIEKDPQFIHRMRKQMGVLDVIAHQIQPTDIVCPTLKNQQVLMALVHMVVQMRVTIEDLQTELKSKATLQ
jgi:hypothetical protein